MGLVGADLSHLPFWRGNCANHCGLGWQCGRPHPGNTLETIGRPCEPAPCLVRKPPTQGPLRGDRQGRVRAGCSCGSVVWLLPWKHSCSYWGDLPVPTFPGDLRGGWHGKKKSPWSLHSGWILARGGGWWWQPGARVWRLRGDWIQPSLCLHRRQGHKAAMLADGVLALCQPCAGQHLPAAC